MNVYLMVVARNEASRYFREFIDYHNFFDGYFLYDDQSDDGTPELAEKAGWDVVIRDEADPSFMEHEGNFRFNSWRAFEKAISPTVDDWIFSIDADEFVISNTTLDVHNQLLTNIKQAESLNEHSIVLLRREIWRVDSNACYLRTDGFWKDDKLYRLFKYRPNAEWSNRSMACGSAPTYVRRNQGYRVSDLSVLHFGYTQDSDMLERYHRYTSLPFHGHNPQHIKSIVARPKLEPYSGPLPEWVYTRFENE